MARRTGRSGRLAARATLALATVLTAPLPAEGQVAVFPRQGLSFGTLRAGTPESVSPADASRRAELELAGSGDVTIEVEVPSVLLSASGRPLPLEFDGDDGIIQFYKSGNQRTFQPGQPTSVRIPPGLGGAYIFVGGTARPGPTQPPGTYTASITVRVMANGT